MGPYVTGLEKVFPGGKFSCFDDGPWPTPKSAAIGVLAQSWSQNDNTAREQQLSNAGYAGGYAKCGSANVHAADTGGLIMLMETHDEARARAMVGGLLIALGAIGDKKVSVPGFPSALAYGHQDNGLFWMDTTLVTGRMVTYLSMHAKAQTEAAKNTGAALTQQRRFTATFVPTEFAKLGLLDDDPHLIGAKTLQPPGNPSWVAGGYTAEQWADVSSTPDTEVPVLKKWGAKEIYFRDGLSHQPSDGPGQTVKGTSGVSLTLAPDAGKARGLLADEITVTKNATPGAKQASLPGHKDVTCLTSTYTGLGSSFPLQQCMFVAQQHFVFISLVDGTTTARDVGPIGKLVASQLKLTPR